MTPSFLYVAFVRSLQSLRLRRTARDDLAIDIVMPRHEVAAAPTRGSPAASASDP